MSGASRRHHRTFWPPDFQIFLNKTSMKSLSGAAFVRTPTLSVYAYSANSVGLMIRHLCLVFLK